MTLSTAIDALPGDVRDRLVRFGQRVERIRVDELPVYAARPKDPAHAEVFARAMASAAADGRTEAVEDARAAMVEFVMERFGNAQYRPTWVGLNWGVSLGSVEDRVRVTRSLSEAVTAIVLWDVLDDGDRDELLGVWADLAS